VNVNSRERQKMCTLYLSESSLIFLLSVFLMLIRQQKT